MPHNAASDQGLHCLITEIAVRNKINSRNAPKVGNGLIHVVRMDKSAMHKLYVNPLDSGDASSDDSSSVFAETKETVSPSGNTWQGKYSSLC